MIYFYRRLLNKYQSAGRLAHVVVLSVVLALTALSLFVGFSAYKDRDNAKNVQGISINPSNLLLAYTFDNSNLKSPGTLFSIDEDGAGTELLVQKTGSASYRFVTVTPGNTNKALELNKGDGFITLYRDFAPVPASVSASVLLKPATISAQGGFLKFGESAYSDHVIAGIRTVTTNVASMFCRPTKDASVGAPIYGQNVSSKWQRVSLIFKDNTMYTMLNHSYTPSCKLQVDASSAPRHVSLSNTWVAASTLYDDLIVTSGNDSREYKLIALDILGDFYAQYGGYSDDKFVASPSAIVQYNLNSLRAAYDAALAFYVYGKVKPDTAAVDRGKRLMVYLSTKEYSTTGGNQVWGQNLQSLVAAYGVMKPSLATVAANIEADAIKYANTFLNTADAGKSIKITTGSTGYARVGGPFKNFREDTSTEPSKPTLVNGIMRLDKQDWVSISFFYDGSGPANVFLGLANVRDPVSAAAGGITNLKSTSFIVSNESTKSRIRDKFSQAGGGYVNYEMLAGNGSGIVTRSSNNNPGTPSIEFPVALVPGWNTLKIQADRDSNSLVYSLNSVTVASKPYISGLSYVNFGSFGAQRSVFAGRLLFRADENKKYGDNIQYKGSENFGNPPLSGQTVSADYYFYKQSGDSIAMVASNSNSSTTIAANTYNYTPWNSPNGGYISDSGGEINAWNAAGLAWFTQHISTNDSTYKSSDKMAYELLARCFAYQSITNSTTRFDSLPSFCKYKTQTVFDDFTVENHSRVHPGYAAAIVNSLAQGQVAYVSAGKPVPAEFKTSNVNSIYTKMKKQEMSGTPFYTYLIQKKDWNGGGDSQLRAGLYMHLFKKVDLKSLISTYRLFFPGIVSHYHNPLNTTTFQEGEARDAYVQNAVMAGEVLAPMFLPLSN